MKDQEFMSFFGLILGILVVITVVVFVIANALSDEVGAMDAAVLEATEKRIAPIGKVNVGDVPAVASAAPADKTSAAAASPESVYQSACQSCHLPGILESPKLDDIAQWQARLAERQLNGLYASAINGRGSMPPKGGRVDLSDDSIKSVVDYMLQKAGVSP